MTQPRARQAQPKPKRDLRTEALLALGNARPSGKGVREARQTLADLARAALLEQTDDQGQPTGPDWATFREIVGHLRTIKARTKAEQWRPSPDERAIGLHVRHTSPAQLRRESESRAQADRTRTPRQQAAQEAHTRNLQRWRAEAMCQALWAVAHGDRDWEAVRVRSGESTAPPNEEPTTASVGQPGVLTIFVPELIPLRIKAHHVELRRHEYEALLRSWGYATLQRIRALESKLGLQATPGQGAAAGELVRLALEGAVTRPALALPWSDYLSSPRLGNVFAYNGSDNAVKLAPRKSGDLREAALEVGLLLVPLH